MPSGNFGNIYAGHVARRMGLPIRRLILATNENDVLDEFFRTGRYRVRRAGAARPPARRWTSPRRRTSSATCSTWSAATARACKRAVAAPGRGGRVRPVALGVLPRVAAVRLRLRRAAPTPTGSRPSGDVIEQLRRDRSTRTPPTASRSASSTASRGVPLICLETALPAKFAATIREALGREPERPAGVRGPRAAAAALRG